ncbi:site-specific DNA-methyltransferase [filamentous cyanobacterium LEGE 11480]|uniref:Methyltransferase n=1 Tax=Romeriopsis navalis LEGE 11480 TaxID=2777977 RepID=A0A928VPN3_9CYAN|nr:site-specific DNA-methyltransferase [Romeriopsis navalis]MBE9030310.1 site-specific DNA-methyltransferase [Romeriopsis navalis LEGE 11480]
MSSDARKTQNRSIVLTDNDRQRLQPILLTQAATTGIIQGDMQTIGPQLPTEFVDLLILDPPYNLTKNFKGYTFNQRSVASYNDWLDAVIRLLMPTLKPDASIYICGDWLTSASIFTVASQHFTVRNRITWEREKGRGAKRNWKNSNEDIWFCTRSADYTFNVEAVKLRRRVLAPYRKNDGSPKDWEETDQGSFRDTHPSNFWSDITIPFWSMPENTEHPTQKSEKLIAKLILASSNPGDTVFDPFLGSGTTAVVANKLDRAYLGIEQNQEYCLLAAKRLEMAAQDHTIQGFNDGVFWERNTKSGRSK